MTTDPDRDALEASLAGRGDYELFPCDPALADTTAFCAAYGFAPEDSANTIVVVGKGTPPVYAACVVLATHRLDVNRTVRGRFGRRSSFAAPEETRAITGHEIGGVTAFGLPDGLPVWIDAAVMARDRIVLGGGSRSWKVIAPSSILLTLPGAEVVQGLANPSSPEPPAPAPEPPANPSSPEPPAPAPEPPANPSSPEPPAPAPEPVPATGVERPA